GRYLLRLLGGLAGHALQGLAFLVQLDAGLIQDGLVGEDRHLYADGQGDRVAGPRVDLHVASVHLEHDAGEEGVVGEVVDDDVFDAGAQAIDDRAQQVVGEGPGDGHFLEADGDGVRLGGPYPDREIAVGLFLFQD